jgi:release factor glutamine methyltransferase
MKNSKEVYSEIIFALNIQEPKEERESIAQVLMEYFFGLDLTAILSSVSLPVDHVTARKLEDAILRINLGEPVQYITGRAEFYKRKFFVTPDVLIPRPETEELVAEVLDTVGRSQNRKPVTIVDVGTGSGCVPITLALHFPDSEVYGTDISAAALEVAKKNATQFHAQVRFLQHDILREKLPFLSIDILTSNPPYISISEKENMKRNVTAFEPHLALFVPDENPLIFYESISRQGRDLLSNGGLLIFEINERFGHKVSQLLTHLGYNDVKILKDLSGKERIVKASQP